MFEDDEDRFYPPIDCSMTAAVCDPCVKKLPWCDSFEKKQYHRLTIDAMVAAMPSRNDSKTRETPTAAAHDQSTAPPVHEDLRKTQRAKKASLPFAELLAASAVAAEDKTPSLAPQSPEAILAKRKRTAGYELDL